MTENKSGDKINTSKLFANEKTRIGFEAAQQARIISKTLTSKEGETRFQLLTFDSSGEDNTARGLAVVFTAGAGMGSGKKGILFVSERTLEILDKLNIVYKKYRSAGSMNYENPHRTSCH